MGDASACANEMSGGDRRRRHAGALPTRRAELPELLVESVRALESTQKQSYVVGGPSDRQSAPELQQRTHTLQRNYPRTQQEVREGENTGPGGTREDRYEDRHESCGRQTRTTSASADPEARVGGTPALGLTRDGKGEEVRRERVEVGRGPDAPESSRVVGTAQGVCQRAWIVPGRRRRVFLFRYRSGSEEKRRLRYQAE